MMVNAKRLWLVVAGGATVALLGLFLWYWQGSAFEIVRTSSGGLAGRGDGHDFILRSADLSSAEQQKALDTIRQAHFFELTSNYTAPGCADALITTLKISWGYQTKTITFEDCGQKDLPSDLVTLDTYLRDLVTK